MKSYKQTADVFAFVEDFLRRIESLFQDLKDETDRKRAELLLDYLRRHKDRYADAMKEYSETEAKTINETWIQYVPHSEYLNLDGLDINPDMSIDDVVEVALELDDRLIAFFDVLQQGTQLPPKVKNVFKRMIDQEQAEKEQIVKTAENMRKL
jgi:hypothetical protein